MLNKKNQLDPSVLMNPESAPPNLSSVQTQALVQTLPQTKPKNEPKKNNSVETKPKNEPKKNNSVEEDLTEYDWIESFDIE